MFKSALVAGAALAALTFTTATAAPASQATGIGVPFHGLSPHPVLVYSQTGGTLTGSVHTQMTVYDNGFVTIGEQSDTIFPTPGVFEGVRTGNIGTAAVKSLFRKLVVAGAYTLGDQPFVVSDVPLNTVTAFSSDPVAGDQTAHTLSYWLPIAEYAEIGELVGEVLAQIPGGGGSSSSQ